jgi:hypothetical protein
MLAIALELAFNSSANHPKAPEVLTRILGSCNGGHRWRLNGLGWRSVGKDGQFQKTTPPRNAPPEGGVARPPRHAHNGALEYVMITPGVQTANEGEVR